MHGGRKGSRVRLRRALETRGLWVLFLMSIDGSSELWGSEEESVMMTMTMMMMMMMMMMIF